MRIMETVENLNKVHAATQQPGEFAPIWQRFEAMRDLMILKEDKERSGSKKSRNNIIVRSENGHVFFKRKRQLSCQLQLTSRNRNE